MQAKGLSGDSELHNKGKRRKRKSGPKPREGDLKPEVMNGSVSNMGGLSDGTLRTRTLEDSKGKAKKTTIKELKLQVQNLMDELTTQRREHESFRLQLNTLLKRLGNETPEKPSNGSSVEHITYKVKLDLPPVYTGEQDIVEIQVWLAGWRNFFAMNQSCSGQKQVGLMVSRLGGYALQRWASRAELEAAGKAEPIKDAQEFFNWAADTMVPDALSRVSMLNMNGDLRSYHQEFMALMAQLPNASFDMRMIWYKGGLDNWLRDEVARKDFETMEEAYAFSDWMAHYAESKGGMLKLTDSRPSQGRAKPWNKPKKSFQLHQKSKPVFKKDGTRARDRGSQKHSLRK